MQNHSYENDFDLHENETICRTHFHMNGFALRLVLKQRYMRTRKWPTELPNSLSQLQLKRLMIDHNINSPGNMSTLFS